MNNYPMNTMQNIGVILHVKIALSFICIIIDMPNITIFYGRPSWILAWEYFDFKLSSVNYLIQVIPKLTYHTIISDWK